MTLSRSGFPSQRLALIISLLYLVLMAWVMRGILLKPVPGYTTGEWLVNYRCGFERRGLGGEILYWVAEWTGQAPLSLLNQWVPAFTMLAMAAGVWLCTRRWWLLLLLVTSPLGLLFWVNNPEVIGRRDPYLLILFSISAWLIIRKPGRKLLWWLLPLSTLGYLLHDGYFFFSMPLLAWLLLAAPNPDPAHPQLPRRQTLVYLLHGVGMLALMYGATLYQASGKIACLAENALQVVAMPGSPTADLSAILCAIEWQGRGIEYTLQQTAQNYLRWDSGAYWLLQLSLAFLAIRWLARQWPWTSTAHGTPAQQCLALVAGIGIWATLFLMAIDWGRYIHILFMQALMLTSLQASTQPPRPQDASPGAGFVVICLAWSLVTVQMVYQGGALEKRMWGYLLDKLLQLG